LYVFRLISSSSEGQFKPDHHSKGGGPLLGTQVITVAIQLQVGREDC
jgi:hypothetical protein